jgi:hypothetical protein
MMYFARLLVRTLLSVAFVLAATPACQSPKKRETQSLAAAVERFLRADNAARPAAAPAIAAVAATDPEVQATKSVCIEASEATSRALTLKSEVEHGLDDLQKGKITKAQAVQRGLDEKLALAMGLLEKGKSKMPLCEDQLMALKQSVGL